VFINTVDTAACQEG